MIVKHALSKRPRLARVVTLAMVCSLAATVPASGQAGTDGPVVTGAVQVTPTMIPPGPTPTPRSR